MEEHIRTLKQINDSNAAREQSLAEHQELILSNYNTQETILESFRLLLNYLDSHVSKTEVVNQLQEIGTPDAYVVAEAVNRLHETLKTHENTDLSEVTALMSQLLEEARQIPKELLELKEREEKDYSDQLKSLESAINAVEKVVKAQKLIAEAPIVNVPQPQVNVDAPNLSPLQEGLKEIVNSVKGIIIPEYKTDNAEVEKLIKKSNTLLEKILDKPVGKGGGGGRATPYETADGVPAFVTLNSDGSVPSGGFDPSADLTTDISTPGVIIETDGIRTLTTTITDTEITEVWS